MLLIYYQAFALGVDIMLIKINYDNRRKKIRCELDLLKADLKAEEFFRKGI